MKYSFESNIRIYFLFNEGQKIELLNVLEDVINTFPYRRYFYISNGDFISLGKPDLRVKTINESFVKLCNGQERERKSDILLSQVNFYRGGRDFL